MATTRKILVRATIIVELEIDENLDFGYDLDEAEGALEQAIMPNVCATPLIRVQVASPKEIQAFRDHVVATHGE